MKSRVGAAALTIGLLWSALIPAHAAQITLRARYVDQLHMEWQFSKAAVVSSVGQYLNAPKGGAFLLIFATVHNIGSSNSYYGSGSFAAAASPQGKPFSVYITGKYYPQLSGGMLRPKESTKGWFAFQVPAHVRKAYVRINDAIDPNDNRVLFTIPTHH
jgi:hypothetical protein